MSNDSSSGANQNASGKSKTAEEYQAELDAVLKNKEEILNEKKKASAKAAELEKIIKDREEKDLKDKEDFKKLLELREKELETTKNEKNQLLSQFERSQKLDAFLSTMDGKVESKYWGMIDLDQIKLLDGKVDTMSVTSLVESFKKTYPELVKTGAGPNLPANAPNGGGTVLTYENWLKLPLKDQKARYKEMRESDKT